jgi:hypothetical protein
VNSWQNPNDKVTVTSPTQAMTGCDRLNFGADLSLQTTNSEADQPTGAAVDLTVPQSTDPNNFGSADLRKAVVKLPEGMTINPALANGLQGCTQAQIGLADTDYPTCPQASKIGTVQLDTPLLETPMTGNVYVAQPHDNPFDSLLGLYLVAQGSGVTIKLPGRVEADPQTGQLTTTFDNNPQLPFSRLRLNLNGGPQAPLVNPPICGTYTTQATLTPWAEENAAPVTANSSVRVASGPGGGPCPNNAFEPKTNSGTANPAAGTYSPFNMRVTRADGTQRLSTIKAALPEGLLGKLAGIPYCSDATLAGIPSAEGTGAAQIASPSCPAASQVGTVTVGAGVGPNPVYINTGRVYLAGPYKGAPLSLAFVTPAVTGPFDLGNVVVRAALQVNPLTAQITAVSDPLPRILYGIPLDLRDVRINMDRSEFTRNPTDCNPTQIGSTFTSIGGASSEFAEPFQVADCAALRFEPKLALRLSGAPPRRGANPALQATLTPPAGNANIGRASVILPATELLEQGHIRTVCTRVQFAANECPEGSIYGHAKAWTPLLDKPLEGPVYLRSNGGERKLPDLVADLKGQINVQLVGYIDSVKRKGTPRIRTRFLSVPDAPVSKFVLDMQGGKKSLLANNTNLCKAKPRAEALLAGQNGKESETQPLVSVDGCGKKGKNKKK